MKKNLKFGKRKLKKTSKAKFVLKRINKISKFLITIIVIVQVNKENLKPRKDQGRLMALAKIINIALLL